MTLPQRHSHVQPPVTAPQPLHIPRDCSATALELLRSHPSPSSKALSRGHANPPPPPQSQYVEPGTPVRTADAGPRAELGITSRTVAAPCVGMRDRRRRPPWGRRGRGPMRTLRPDRPRPPPPKPICIPRTAPPPPPNLRAGPDLGPVGHSARDPLRDQQRRRRRAGLRLLLLQRPAPRHAGGGRRVPAHLQQLHHGLARPGGVCAGGGGVGRGTGERHATFSTAPAHQLLGSANAETTPAGAPAAAADRTQRPDATCEGTNG